MVLRLDYLSDSIALSNTKYQNTAENAEKELKEIFHSPNRSVLANAFLSDLSQNCQALSPGVYRYTPATYVAAYVLKNISPNAYEFLRCLMPLPQSEYINDTFAEQEDIISQTMSEDHEPSMEGLETYKTQSIPEGYINTRELDGISGIAAVLGVAAMAVDPYSGFSKPSEGPEVEEWYRYLFVYYLQHLDHAVPNTGIEGSRRETINVGRMSFLRSIS
jgi:hypothetical protein